MYCETQRWERVPVYLCVPACPSSSIFPSRSDFLYNIFFAFLCTLAFLFRVPMLLCQRVYVWAWGATHHTRAVCVWTDQAGRVNSPSRHSQPPFDTCARCRSMMAGSRFGVNLISRPQSPPSTSPLHLFHIITVSSLRRNANIAFVFFRVPCSRVPAFLYNICIPSHPRS